MSLEATINNLSKRVTDLERKIANRIAVTLQPPKIKVCKIVSSSTVEGATVYKGNEISVAGELDTTIEEIGQLPGSSPLSIGDLVTVGQDENSKSFYFPSGTGLLLVQDLGVVGGKRVGKQINKSPAGVISTPSGSQTLELVAIEPDSSFHNSTPSFGEGRVYLGYIRQDGGQSYYYIFLEGHGDGEKTFSVSIVAAGTWSLTITTDNAGKVTGVAAS